MKESVIPTQLQVSTNERAMLFVFKYYSAVPYICSDYSRLSFGKFLWPLWEQKDMSVAELVFKILKIKIKSWKEWDIFTVTQPLRVFVSDLVVRP